MEDRRECGTSILELPVVVSQPMWELNPGPQEEQCVLFVLGHLFSPVTLLSKAVALGKNTSHL